uniref:Uncharacterized protein n=1 Tax=viral metagenome TaxID=1070528 RepID=A0A6C0LW03_9ZZZZ
MGFGFACSLNLCGCFSCGCPCGCCVKQEEEPTSNPGMSIPSSRAAFANAVKADQQKMDRHDN